MCSSVFTDGITEARAGRQRFGETRLRTILNKIGELNATDIADTITAKAKRYADKLDDDIVVLVVKVARQRTSHETVTPPD